MMTSQDCETTPLPNMSDSISQSLTQQSDNPSLAVKSLKTANKHVFAPISCLPYENNIVYCFVLSAWDNIIGPQTVQVWKRRKNAPLEPHNADDGFLTYTRNDKQLYRHSQLYSIAQYVSEHTVTLGQSQDENDYSPTLLVLPHHKLVLQTVRFSVVEEGVPVPHSLSLVIPSEEEKTLLKVSQLTGSYLIRIVKLFSVLLQQQNLASIGQEGVSPLCSLCSMLLSLHHSSLSQYPLLPTAQQPSDSQLSLLLLTSHLQTRGYSIVIGDTTSSVNKVILWLALFLSDRELYFSRLCLDSQQTELYAGLVIQGLVTSDGKGCPITAEMLLEYGRPVTVCNLNDGTVRQSLPQTSGSMREVVKDVTKVSSQVKDFLKDMEFLTGHSNVVKRGYITSFRRSLQYQALSIIAWIRHNKFTSVPNVLATLRTVHDLDEATLDLLIAVADSLQPGMKRMLTP